MQMNFVYCRDDLSSIENYDKALADNFKGWVIHHKLETHDKWGRRREQEIPSKVLMFLGLYYFRPANELIWLSNSEHCSLHNSRRHHSDEAKAKLSRAQKGRKHSEEHNAKVSAALKGKPSPNKGHKPSDEARAKMSAAKKGKTPWNKGKPHSEETKAKIAAAMKGKKRKPHSDETKLKISNSMKNKTNKLEGN